MVVQIATAGGPEFSQREREVLVPLALGSARRAELWLPVVRELKRRKHIPQGEEQRPIWNKSACAPHSGSRLVCDSGQVLRYGQL